MKGKRRRATRWAFSPVDFGTKASTRTKMELWRSYLTPCPRPLTPRPKPSGDVICIPPAVAARELSEFEMSVRLRGVLALNNCWRLGDLYGVAYADLLQLRNCGKVTVAELKKLVGLLQAGAELLPGQPAAADPAPAQPSSACSNLPNSN